MIEWISNLPKLIDTLIVGVIEMVYRFLGGTLAVWRSPVEGVKRLEEGEEYLSSRTMLFASVVLFMVNTFVGQGNLGILSESGFLPFLITGALVYMALDGLAALGARFCRRRDQPVPVDKARDYLRYAFGAAILLPTLALILFQLVVDTHAAPGSAGARVTPLSGLLTLATFAAMALAAYPVAAVLVMLSGIAGGLLSRLAVIALWTATLNLALYGVWQGMMAGLGKVSDMLRGSLFINPASCIAASDGVRIVIGVQNESPRPELLTRRSLNLVLTYTAGGRTEVVPLSGMEKDAVLAGPRQTMLVNAAARPDSDAYRALVRDKGQATCALQAARGQRHYKIDDTLPVEFAAPPPAVPTT